ncbi:hypothetical protein [Salinarimonas rosea]|uniref:hypothetical protein n=1 Tax=Salinarimonas rosea TaxID=552063 RepID=UPI000428AAAC|nr:hypothetical protein [Salinarimonas rosea]
MKFASPRATFLALATVAALSAAPALAQQQAPASAAPAAAIDRGTLIDARLAGIRAGLDLSPDQAALFEPVAEAWRSVAQSRAERREAMRAERGTRMQERFGDRDGPGRGPRDGMGQGMGPGQGQGMGPAAGRGMGPDAGRGMGPDADRGPGDGLDFMERLDRRAAVSSAHADEIGRLAEAMRPFWESLDAEQQALLPVLVRELGGFDAGPRRGGDGHRGGRYHHGRG